MPTIPFLAVEIRDLPPLEVIHKYCLFAMKTGNADKTIRAAFAEVRELVASSGLDPDILLHIGVLELDGETLVGYDCCIEFPLPFKNMPRKTLSGGRYAVLTVEKTPARIGKAIRQFVGDYIPDHDLVVDVERPTYEIYYKDTLEYCVPIQ